MALKEMLAGESRLFGALGANLTLGGVRLAEAHTALIDVMPIVSDILVFVQVAVGIATLIYMVLKIRKILKK